MDHAFGVLSENSLTNPSLCIYVCMYIYIISPICYSRCFTVLYFMSVEIYNPFLIDFLITLVWYDWHATNVHLI